MRKLKFVKPTKNPALSLAREIFEALKPEKNACSFPKHFVIAPTKDALRDIQFELARLAFENSKCALGGIVFLTPESFFNIALSDNCLQPASKLESLIAMQHALKHMESDEREAIMANFEDPANAMQTAALAGQILRLRKLCAEAGASLADTANRLIGDSFFDSKKFAALAKIEKRFLENLKLLKKIDSSDALLQALKNPNQKLVNSRIFIASVPDAPAIFFRLLERLCAEFNANAKIYVLSDIESAFDEFGRPIAEYWQEKILDIRNENLRLSSDLHQQAKEVAFEASKIESPAKNLAIAAEVGESEQAIISELRAVGLDGFSPSGAKLSDGIVFKFAQILRDYFEDPNFFNLSCLVKSGPFLELLSKHFDRDFVFKVFDEFQSKHIALNLKSAIELSNRNSDAHKLFEFLQGTLESEGEACDRIEASFNSVFSNLKTCDNTAIEAFDSISEALRVLRKCTKIFGKSDIAESLRYILEFADERVFKESRGEEQIYIKNWLEIFWSRQEHIFLADFNDGKVPEKISADPFMTDSLRGKLGIRNSAFRHARDAYFLHTLLSCRDVKFFIPKIDSNADALRPSRLLLQTGDKQLPKRAEILFMEVASPKSNTHFSKSWNLKIPRVPLPEHLSATDFKAYLDCPFEFYLRRILKLQTFDAFKAEADARDSGTLIHGALQRLAEVKFSEPEKIEKFLLDALDAEFLKAFGKNPAPAVEFQKYFLGQRLKKAAQIESAHRQQGWEILDVETPCENLQIGEFKIRGRIDRIDKNALGEYLIIDYKTGEKIDERAGVSAAESAHLKKSSKKSEGEKIWKDLQLPLYAEFVARKFGVKKVLCAYFTLPEAVSNADLKFWEIDEETRNSALLKAEEIAEKISRREFAPAENSKLQSNFAPYFDFADSISDFLEYE